MSDNIEPRYKPGDTVCTYYGANLSEYVREQCMDPFDHEAEDIEYGKPVWAFIEEVLLCSEDESNEESTYIIRSSHLFPENMKYNLSNFMFNLLGAQDIIYKVFYKIRQLENKSEGEDFNSMYGYLVCSREILFPHKKDVVELFKKTKPKKIYPQVSNWP